MATWLPSGECCYEEVWCEIFGPRWKSLPTLFITIAYVTCIVTGAWEINYYVGGIVPALWPSAPDILFSPWLLKYVGCFVAALPCWMTLDFSPFQFIGHVSGVALVVAFASLVVFFFRTEYQATEFVREREIKLFNPTFSYVSQVFGNFNTAFFAHPYVGVIARELSNATRGRVLRLTWIVNIICAVFTYSVAFVSYLFFSGVEDGENIFYSLDPDAPEVSVGKIAVLVVSLCSTSLFTFFLSKRIAAFIDPYGEHHQATVGVTSVSLTLLCCAIDMMDDFGQALIFEVGSISFSVLAFVFPPVYYLARFGFQRKAWALASIFVLVVGFFWMVDGFIATVQELLGM